jgi:hypothetical protein
MMLKALLALVAIALFTGGSLYVTIAEHPGRLRLDDNAGAAHLTASARRAGPLMGGLAMIALLLGLWAGLKTGDAWLIAAAVLIGLAIPFTFAAVIPVNRRIEAGAGTATRVLLVRWGQLHLVRTALGIAALAACLIAFARP